MKEYYYVISGSICSVFIFVLMVMMVKSCDHRDSYNESQTYELVDTVKLAAISRNQEYRIFVLDNGIEIWQGAHEYHYMNANLKQLASYQRTPSADVLWDRAKVGQSVRFIRCYERRNEKKADRVLHYCVDFILHDYIKNRIVKEVYKYDGNMSKMNGKVSRNSFWGAIDGNIKAEGSSSENFYINVYFTEGNPLAVDAKQNQLFMDLVPGDTVCETMINGNCSYIIKKKN